MSYCLLPDDICTKEESGDRIPDDLTVAPTRVDAMTVLLSCIAMGMQVFKYSTTTHETTLAGGVGSVSSSIHPVLEGLLHYSVFSDVPTTGLKAAKRHAHALRHKEGVWANAVFGRFRDRSYRPEMVPLDWLMEMKIPILRQNGWSEDHDADGDADTIGGAASFMAFGHVDVYEAAPPSLFRRYATHFAEVIVKAHHVETLMSRSRPQVTELPGIFSKMLEDYGYSSPYLPPDLTTSPYVYDPTAYRDLKASIMLVYRDFLDDLQLSAKDGWESLCEDLRDPSSYCSPAVMWHLICLADSYMSQMQLHISQQHSKNMQPRADGAKADETWRMKDILSRVEAVVARSIHTLCAVGAPSWGNASEVIKAWPRTFETTCDEVLIDLEECDQSLGNNVSPLKEIVRLYAELSILRSAYFTVMIRAAHPLGPGLNRDSRIETALAYMA